MQMINIYSLLRPIGGSGLHICMGGMPNRLCLFFAMQHILPSTDCSQRRGWQAGKTPKRIKTMNIARTLNNWRKYRQTVSELDRMSNRGLSDLGIDRSDIRRLARQATGF